MGKLSLIIELVGLVVVLWVIYNNYKKDVKTETQLMGVTTSGNFTQEQIALGEALNNLK